MPDLFKFLDTPPDPSTIACLTFGSIAGALFVAWLFSPYEGSPSLALCTGIGWLSGAILGYVVDVKMLHTEDN